MTVGLVSSTGCGETPADSPLRGFLRGFSSCLPGVGCRVSRCDVLADVFCEWDGPCVDFGIDGAPLVLVVADYFGVGGCGGYRGAGVWVVRELFDCGSCGGACVFVSAPERGGSALVF